MRSSSSSSVWSQLNKFTVNFFIYFQSIHFHFSVSFPFVVPSQSRCNCYSCLRVLLRFFGFATKHTIISNNLSLLAMCEFLLVLRHFFIHASFRFGSITFCRHTVKTLSPKSIKLEERIFVLIYFFPFHSTRRNSSTPKWWKCRRTVKKWKSKRTKCHTQTEQTNRY